MLCVCVCACMRACVRACMHACVRACACVCVCVCGEGGDEYFNEHPEFLAFIQDQINSLHLFKDLLP